MLIACNKGAGANIHTPDVCLTPPVPVPVPYVNTAFNATASIFVPNILVTGMPALNLASMLATSVGDEPGTAHWTIMGWSKYVVGNPVVFVAMLPGENLTCATIGNKGNAASGLVAIPSATNVLYTYAGSNEVDVEALGERMSLVSSEPAIERTGADGVTTIRVPLVTRAAAMALSHELRSLDPDASLLLDLRGNPGGDLRAALDIIELFTEAGRELAAIIDAHGDRSAYVSDNETPASLPLAILVDRSTASAAELIAGSLQANGRATIVGERTFGKGTIQAFIPTPQGRELQTIALVELPNGAPLDAVGVTPDL